jgi:glutaredoxin
MRLRAAFALALALTLALGGAGACREKEDDGTTPRATDEQLPALTLRDDTPNLMLTWLDDKGETHVELHPADVPAAGRDLVRVVVTDREEGTRDLFYVADLTKKRDDGSYLAQTMPRRSWEAMIAKRREEYIARTSPPPPPQQPGLPGLPGLPGPPGAPSPNTPAPPGALAPPGTGLTAIIYGADWCKPCHEAADYLKSKGVAVIHKDVEESAAAQAEMREKLAKTGQHGGSIPVIDLRGQIIVGFSRGSLDRAIAKATAGTVL